MKICVRRILSAGDAEKIVHREVKACVGRWATMIQWTSIGKKCVNVTVVSYLAHESGLS